MIPRTSPSCQSDEAQLIQTDCPTTHWQRLLADAIREPAELLEYLNLPKSLLNGVNAANRSFALRVPRGYCQNIEKGNQNDPLLRQILPLEAELSHDSAFTLDPVADLDAMEVPGLLHKYHGRVLIITTVFAGTFLIRKIELNKTGKTPLNIFVLILISMKSF